MNIKCVNIVINEQTSNDIRNHLVPLSSLVTPNIPEAEFLLETNISSKDDMENAAFRIVKELGANAALVKGGHRKGDAIDYLYVGNEIHTLSNKRINNKNNHTNGCTYAAALTNILSKG